MDDSNPLKQIPSVDRFLSSEPAIGIIERFGRQRVTHAVRVQLEQLRGAVQQDAFLPIPDAGKIAVKIESILSAEDRRSMVPVINLTGTVLHTNLGRASLSQSALEAIYRIAGGTTNLEFDLTSAGRGDRDDHVEALLRELTGAEAVTVVNNNAAAVLISLNTLAQGREVCISRGELVEIGGSFRIPEVMEKAYCTLREVGATNRTHLKDYEQAISAATGLLMKVHTSNYQIQGFTAEVSYEALAGLSRKYDLPLLVDLGSGTLIDLEHYGLAHEPTVQEVLATGVDLITFSGDKLLGGPQAGIIAGRQDLVDRIKQNPLKRALRVDKMTMAALAETLKLYRQPETLAAELPTLRHLTRKPEAMQETASHLLPALRKALASCAQVTITPTTSQIGSGALPLNQLPSVAMEVTPLDSSNRALQAIAAAFRQLPCPVVGRIHDGRLLFDLRTLDDPALLIDQLGELGLP